MNQFLSQEYKECFEQLRFYDSRQMELLKFMVGLSSAVATVAVAADGLLGHRSEWRLPLLAGVLLLTLIGLSMLMACMVQNRVYFVFVARQLNAIRIFRLEHEAPEFRDNQMYGTTRVRSFRWGSLHTLVIFGGVLLASSYAAAGTACVMLHYGCGHVVWIAGGVGALVFIVEGLAACLTLRGKGNQTADAAIRADYTDARKRS